MFVILKRIVEIANQLQNGLHGTVSGYIAIVLVSKTWQMSQDCELSKLNRFIHSLLHRRTHKYNWVFLKDRLVTNAPFSACWHKAISP